MKIYFAISLFFFSTNLYSQKKFTKFLDAQISYQKAQQLKSEKKYKDAIKLFYLSSVATNIQYGSYKGILECSVELYDIENAKKYLAKITKMGYVFSKFQKLDSIENSVLEHTFIKNRIKYKRLLDIETQEILLDIQNKDQLYRSMMYGVSKNTYDSLFKIQSKLDSENVIKLKKIILSKRHWPDKNTFQRELRIRPEIIALHSSENDNIFFLKYAINGAKKGYTDWFAPISIQSNLLWRFQYEKNSSGKIEGFNRLRKIKILKNGKLNINSNDSYFEIYCLSKFLLDNSSSKIIFYRLGDNIDLNLLKQLGELIIKEGVNPERIMYETDKHLLKPQISDKNAFVFKLVE